MSSDIFNLKRRYMLCHW